MVKVRRGSPGGDRGVATIFYQRTLPLARSLQSAVPTPCRLDLGFCYYDKAVLLWSRLLF